MDVSEHLSSLGVDPLELEEGEVVTGAVLLLRIDSADGPSGLAHCVSPGLSHWEGLGMLLDALDSARAEGLDPSW